MTHQADVTHSGIAKYVLKSEENQENDNTATKKNNYPNKSTDNRQNITISTDANTHVHSTNALDVPDVTQASPPSPRPQATCLKCREPIELFYLRVHIDGCQRSKG